MGAIDDVIILHGWTTSLNKWGPFLVSLRENGIHAKLLAIPGLTDKIKKPWNLDDYVDWIKKEIGTKKVVLIGHSNGGRIALAFSNKFPKNIKQLILIDSAGIYHKKFFLQIKRLLFKGAAKIGKKLVKSDNLRNILYKLAGESDYKNADEVQRQTMVNLISVDLTNILEKINIPTLIIWGKEDSVTPLSDGIMMHKLIKGSKLKIIDSARHSPQFTRPEEVAKEILEYL